MGAQLVKEVATKTNDVAGDGTTTATVLAQALVHLGMRNVAAGANPMSLKKGIEKAVAAAVESIKSQAKDVDDKSDIANVATISAADPSIGEVIADAIDKVGKDGVVTVEESNTFGTELEFTEGMQFDKGYLSPYFVTDAERQEAVLDEPYLLIHQAQDLDGAGPAAGARGRHEDRPPLAHHRRGRRGRGPRHARRQQDPRHVQRRRPSRPRASATAARRCCRTWRSSPAPRSSARTSGLKLENVTLDLLGTAKRVIITKDNTTIVDGGGTSDDVKGRINQIKAEIENTDSDWDREKLQERLAKLAGGVAVIKVGAATEVELKEKKHRIEDAVSATRAAIEEGVVAGGGTALAPGPSGRRRRSSSRSTATRRPVPARCWEALVAPATAHRRERRPRGLGVGRSRSRPRGRQRPQRRHRRADRPGQGRHHRPRQGHPGGAAERGVDRGAWCSPPSASSPTSPSRRRHAGRWPGGGMGGMRGMM